MSDFVSVEDDHGPPSTAQGEFVKVEDDNPKAPQPMRAMPDKRSEADYQGWVQANTDDKGNFHTPGMGDRTVKVDPYGNGVDADLRAIFHYNAPEVPAPQQRQVDVTPQMLDRYQNPDSPQITADSVYAKGQPASKLGFWDTDEDGKSVYRPAGWQPQSLTSKVMQRAGDLADKAYQQVKSGPSDLADAASGAVSKIKGKGAPVQNLADETFNDWHDPDNVLNSTVVNPLLTGAQKARQGADVIAANSGLASDKGVESYAADIAAAEKATPPLPAYRREADEQMSKAGSAFGVLDAFLSNPRAALASAIQGLSQSGASMGLSAAAGATGGLVTGGPVGAGAGVVGGAAAGGYFDAYGQTMVDTMRAYAKAEGYDMTNPADVQAMLKDPHLMAQAAAVARERGIPAAVINAVSFGLAGKLYKPVASAVAGRTGSELAGKAAGIGAEATTQGAIGAGGTAATQELQQGKITDVPAIAAAGISQAAQAGVFAALHGTGGERDADFFRKDTGNPNGKPFDVDDLPGVSPGKPGAPGAAAPGKAAAPSLEAPRPRLGPPTAAEKAQDIAAKADDPADITVDHGKGGSVISVQGEPIAHAETPMEANRIATDAKQQVDERRIDLLSRKNIDDMTSEESKEAAKLYKRESETDALTGIPGLRGWERMQNKGPVITMMDLDGFKWTNDEGGHELGNQHLKAVASALQAAAPGRVARKGGDEFVMHSATPEDAQVAIGKAQGILAKVQTEITHKDGTKTRFTGIGLSHGTGDSIETADKALSDIKDQRQRAGLRPARGEPPIGAVRTAPETRLPGDQGSSPDAGRNGERVLTVLGQQVKRPEVPTDEQKKSGDYYKPVVEYHGLPIKVENVSGSYRKGTDAKGKKWKSRFKEADYGYFEGTRGNDGDAVDVFMGKHPDTGTAYVIDQLDPTGKHFDEHKVVIGVASREEAEQLYLRHYPQGWKGLGGITELPVPLLKAWLHGDEHTLPIDPDSVPQEKIKRGKGPNPKHDSLLEYLARHPRGLDAQEAEAQGIDKADMNLPHAKVGIRRAFRKGGMSFDHAAETLAQDGYPVLDEKGNYDPNTLLDKLDEELRGNKVYSNHNESNIPDRERYPEWLRKHTDQELDQLSPEDVQKQIDRLQGYTPDEDVPFARPDDFSLTPPGGKAGAQPEKQKTSSQAQQDLFGDPVGIKNEIERLKAALDKKLKGQAQGGKQPGQDDLFSQARQQEEMPGLDTRGETKSQKAETKPTEPETPAPVSAPKAAEAETIATRLEAIERQLGLKPDAKLDDVGQKIGGARKDKWAERGMSLDDLASMSDGEAAQLVGKGAVWKPDWSELVENGMEPEAAALNKIIWDKLGAKPRNNTPEGRKAYVETLQAVRQIMEASKTVADVKRTQELVMERIGYDKNDHYSLNRSPEAEAARTKFWSIHNGRKSVLSPGFAHTAAARKLLEAGFPGERMPWQRTLRVDQTGDGDYRVSDRKTWKQISRHPTRAQAIEAAKAAYAEAEAAKPKAEREKEGPPKRPHLDVLKRSGLPTVRQGDADPNDFLRDFGFRGLEFGNWAANDERQKLVNLAYDALHDLASVLGIPPKALSLNGTMGLALGARGGGFGVAHYEPGKLVINMTKLSGAGSLAHEFGHALDHYFGEMGRPDAYKTDARGASGWYQDPTHRTWAHLRPEMQAAWKGVMDAMFNRDKTRAEGIRDRELNLEKMEAELRQQEKRQADAIARNTTDKKFLKNNASWIDMRRRQIENAKLRLEEARNGPDEPGTYGKVATEYKRAAEALSNNKSGGYWRRPTEMFARAFESYVQDQLKARGAVSDYLVHSTDEPHLRGDKGDPYPREDRPAINAAIQKLVDTLQTRPEGDHEVLFSRPESDEIKEEGKASELAEPPRQPKGKSPQLDLFTNAAKPQVHQQLTRQAAQFGQSVKLHKIGEFHTGHKVIDTWQKAAHVIAPIRKNPQEMLVALVLDAQNRPLAVIRHSIGMIDRSHIEHWSMAGSIAQIPNARAVYFAHNHPSGNLMQSPNADHHVTRSLTNLLHGTGIRPMGMIVVSPGKAQATFHGLFDTNPGDAFTPHQIAAAGRTQGAVPMVTRRIAKTLQPNVGSVAKGQHKSVLGRRLKSENFFDLVDMTGLKSGILLTDHQSNVVAVVPMEPGDMMKLRTEDATTGAAKLLATIAQANANQALPFGPLASTRNVAVFMNASGVRTLGLVNPVAQTFDGEASLPGGFMYASRDGAPGAMAPADIQAKVQETLKRFAVQPKGVVVAKNLAELKADPDLAHLLRYEKDGDVTAFYLPRTGKIYIVADQIKDENHLAGVVAHEYVTHFGLRARDGSPESRAYQAILKGVREAMPADVDARGQREFGAAWNPENPAMQAKAAEETLAYYSQRQAEGGAVPSQFRAWLDKWHQWIRDTWRKLWGMAPKFDDLWMRNTVNDLREFLRKAPESEPQGEAEPSFAKPENTFYSAVERAVDSAKRDKGTGAEWEATLRNTPGVKAEEMEWLGLKDWLQDRGRVTKAEVAEYVRAHRIDVQEVMKGERSQQQLGVPEEHIQNLIRQFEEAGHEMPNNELYILEDGGPDAARLLDKYERLGYDVSGIPRGSSDYEGDTPRYANYVSPGGKNYREMLLKLPDRTPAHNALDAHLNAVSRRTGGPFTHDVMTDDEYDRYTKLSQAVTDEANRPQYHSGHWEEPNILVHARFDERQLPTGERTLHIAEIQSDWHHAGKQRGYLTSKKITREQLNETQERAVQVLRANDNLGFDTVGQALNAVLAHEDWTHRWDVPLGPDRDTVQNFRDTRLAFDKVGGQVPDAPFKTTWQDLALKRLLRHAVDNGFDALSWDTGQTVAERFGLVKHIDSLAYNGRDFVAYGKNGTQVHRYTGANRESIAQLVGPEIAQRLIDAPVRNGLQKLHDLDLRLGTAGKEAIYDKMLPQKMGKIIGKWGGKVEQGTVNHELGHKLAEVEARVAEFQASHGLDPDEPLALQLKDLSPADRAEAFDLDVEHERVLAADGEGRGGSQSVPAHIVRINDAMRHGVPEGMPLFARPEKPAETPKDERTLFGRPGVGGKVYDVARRALMLPFNNKSVAMPIRAILNPRSYSEISKQAAQRIVPYLADLARQKEIALQQLEQFAREVDKLPYKAQLQSYHEAETGQPQSDPRMQPVMDALQKLLRDKAEQVQAMGPGHLDTFIENYLPHYYTDPAKAKKFFAGPFGRRPLRGPATFKKQRYYATLRDAMEKGGLTPLTSNPLIQSFLKLYEMDKYMNGVAIRNMATSEHLAEYFPMSKRIPEGWTEVDDPAFRVSTWSDEEGGFVQRGRWAMPDDAARLLNNHLGVNHLANFNPAMTFRQLANSMTMFQLGFSGFHVGFTSTDALVSKNALAYERLIHGEPLRAAAAFLESFSGPYGVWQNISRGRLLEKAYLNPRGSTPELQLIANAFVGGGGRIRMPVEYEAAQGLSPFHGVTLKHLADDLRKVAADPDHEVWDYTKTIGSVGMEYANKYWRALTDLGRTHPLWQLPFMAAGRMVRMSTAFIMEKIVPWQKQGVFVDMAQDFLRRNPNASPIEVNAEMQRITHSIDNRLGEVVYDNNFWNRSFKMTLHLSLRAVGWRFGTIQEIGGGIHDTVKAVDKLIRTGKLTPADFTHKMGYLLGLLTIQGVSGALLQYLLTGEAPRDIKDIFFPRTGYLKKDGSEERLSLPTYVKDMYGYLTQPGHEIASMLNPILGELYYQMTNADYFGDPIYDPDDTTWEQIHERAEHFIHAYTPFVVENTQHLEAAQEKGVIGAAARIGNFFGLKPTPKSISNPEAEPARQHYEDEKRYEKKLRFDLRQAREAQDAEKVKEIQRRLMQGRKESAESKAEYMREKAAGEKRAKEHGGGKTSSLLEHIGPLIDQSSSRAEMAQRIEQAGYPALAGLLGDLPDQIRPQVRARLAEYA